jgi:transcriptional regulator with XRE-family HTH domain
MAQQGLTIKLVAESCDLDERTIRGALNGTNRPHARTIHTLATGLGVSADELFLPPTQLLYRHFDRGTNPVVEGVMEAYRELFSNWTEVDFDELHSRVGTGGALTVQGTVEIVRVMNRNRETHEKLDVLLENEHAELARETIDVFYRNVSRKGS